MRNRALTLVLATTMLLGLAGEASARSSKHALVKNGIGNIVVGESLPYGNDAGWRSFVKSGGTLKASTAFRTWKEFYVRAFFKDPLKKIGWEGHRKNAIAYFMVFQLPNGKVYQPKGRAPAILYFFGERGTSSPKYMMRDSHGMSWRQRARRDWPPGYYQIRGRIIDVKKPGTFLLTYGGDLKRGQFRPWNFGRDLKKALKAGGGKVKLIIYCKVFKFKGVYTVSAKREFTGRDRKRPWIKHHSYRIMRANKYDSGKLIAKGTWTIVQ